MAFSFHAPQQGAFDPSTLEGVFAQSAGRQMGPGFNLAGLLAATSNREGATQQYQQMMNAINQQAQAAGEKELAAKQLNDMMGHAVTFSGQNGGVEAASPLSQFARGMGGRFDVSQMSQDLAKLAVQGALAKQFGDVGKGASDFANAGFNYSIPGQGFNSSLFGARTPGSTGGERAASITASASLKPRLTTTLKGDTGMTDTSLTVAPGMNDPRVQAAKTPATPVDAANRTSDIAEVAGFNSEMNKLKITTTGMKDLGRSSITAPNGTVHKNVRKFQLPNGSEFAYINGGIVQVK